MTKRLSLIALLFVGCALDVSPASQPAGTTILTSAEVLEAEVTVSGSQICRVDMGGSDPLPERISCGIRHKTEYVWADDCSDASPAGTVFTCEVTLPVGLPGGDWYLSNITGFTEGKADQILVSYPQLRENAGAGGTGGSVPGLDFVLLGGTGGVAGSGGTGGTGGTPWTPVDGSEWPGEAIGASCPLGVAISSLCLCDGMPYTEGYCLQTLGTDVGDEFYSFSDGPTLGRIYYVAPGASGDGGSWASPANESTLGSQRDAVYWIASGDYGEGTGTITFDTAGGSPTSGIVIRKATEAEHGTDNGWQTSYGQGQARFGSVQFGSDYWTIDGGENNGIRFRTPGIFGAGEPYAVVQASDRSRIVLRRVEIDAAFAATDGLHTQGTCHGVSAIDAGRIVLDRAEVHTFADDGLEFVTTSDSKLYRSKVHGGYAYGHDRYGECVAIGGVSGSGSGQDCFFDEDCPSGQECGSPADPDTEPQCGDGGCGPCFNGHTDLLEVALNSDDFWAINNLIYDAKGGTGALFTQNWVAASPNERHLYVNNLILSQGTGIVATIQDCAQCEFYGNIIAGTAQGSAFGGFAYDGEARLTARNNYFTNINTTLLGGNDSIQSFSHNVYGILDPGEHTIRGTEVDLGGSGVDQFVGIPYTTSVTELNTVAENLVLGDLEPTTFSSLLGAGTGTAYNYDIRGLPRPQTTHDSGAWDRDIVASGGSGGSGGTGGGGGSGPTCAADPSITYTATNGWSSPAVVEPNPATGTLVFEFYLRAGASGTDSGIAVYQSAPVDWSDASLGIKFAPNNEIQVMIPGGVEGYECSPGPCPSYQPNTWYRFIATAYVADPDGAGPIEANTYTVQYEQCDNGPLATLHDGAPFRAAAASLEHHRAWTDSQPFDVSEVSWDAGACVPQNCAAQGFECGAPPNGPEDTCGSDLDCDTEIGGCTGGQVCEPGSWTCCTRTPNWCTAANDPDLNCGTHLDNCGVEVDCGTCPSGQECQSGICCVPDPNACDNVDCGTVIESTCGTQVVCPDTCVAPLECNQSTNTCVDPGTGNWWETTLKPNAANTGPNCSGRPGCPDAPLLAANAPPTTIIQDGATYENFVWTGNEIYVEADNVTFRNFQLLASNMNSTTLIRDRTGSNLVLEYGYLDGGGGNCGEFVQGQGYTIRFSELRNCADITKADNGSGSGPILIEDSYLHDAIGGHGDVMQIWPVNDTNITIRRSVLEAGNTAAIIDWAISSPARLLVENSWIEPGPAAGWGIYCSNDGGGQRIYQNNLFARGWNFGPVTDAGCTWINNLWDDDFTEVPYNP